MSKPKAITRARDALRDAETIHIMAGASFHLSVDGSVPEPGPYKIIREAEAAALVAALTKADARTRYDPSKRAKPKKKAARQKR